MGDVIYIADRREQSTDTLTRRGARSPVTFSFDLACPQTYLAAERVDRSFTKVRWVPALSGAEIVDRRDIEARAARLRLPLVWPEPPLETSFRAAMRVARYAADQDRAAPFVLAACRLAFCGGFDLDDPEILAEAVEAAGLPLDAAMRVAGDREIDAELEACGERLLAQGADRLPVLAVGRRLFCGEERLAEAVVASRPSARAPRRACPGTPSTG